MVPVIFPGASPGNWPLTRGMALICCPRAKRKSWSVMVTSGQQGSLMVREVRTLEVRRRITASWSWICTMLPGAKARPTIQRLAATITSM